MLVPCHSLPMASYLSTALTCQMLTACKRGAMLLALQLLALTLLRFGSLVTAMDPDTARLSPIVVVGSINVDMIIHIDKLGQRGETKIALKPSATYAVGGKGANQAVAAQLLSDPHSKHPASETDQSRESAKSNSAESESADWETAGPAPRPPVRFIGRLGADAHVAWLRDSLQQSGVDVSGCQVVQGMDSGTGVVWLDADGGATSVVLGGANAAGWPADDSVLQAAAAAALQVDSSDSSNTSSQRPAAAAALMLQREVPERVNIAYAAAARRAGVRVLLDAGGDSSLPSTQLMSLLDYLCPNEQELQALTQGMPTGSDEQVLAAARMLVEQGARSVLVTLEARGALLLQAARNGTLYRMYRQPPLPVPGGMVVDATAAGDAFRAAFTVALVEGRSIAHALRWGAAAGAHAVTRMGALPSLPTRDAVEALLAGLGQQEGWASEQDVDLHLGMAGAHRGDASAQVGSSSAARGTCFSSPWHFSSHCSGSEGSSVTGLASCATASAADGNASAGEDRPVGSAGAAWRDDACPLLMASRLNSMRARRDLVTKQPAQSSTDRSSMVLGEDGNVVHTMQSEAQLQADTTDNVLGWVARQGSAGVVDVVYFNYPEHFDAVGGSMQEVAEKLLSTLSSAGLHAGGVSMRFPSKTLHAGAFTNPDPALRHSALELCVDGCKAAHALGTHQLVVWSAFDGYGGLVCTVSGVCFCGFKMPADYPFQVDYAATWANTLHSYRTLADACAPLGVNVSIEWKPTDPASRNSFISNTATALLLAQGVDRPNFGLALDAGHMLMAGESWAGSIVAVANAGKLFGLHLNDGHARMGGEDGLTFGSVHATAALELVYWLRRLCYTGHIYFDTFPLNEDPVREVQYNVRHFQALWAAAGRLHAAGMERCMQKHDALCGLELLQHTGRTT